MTNLPSRRALPLILIRGFGGVSVQDERRIAYQGFNDGTVYPHKRGENYIYEGLILRFMKSDWRFQDATNVVGYFPAEAPPVEVALSPALAALDPSFFSGHKVVVDPAMALHLLEHVEDPRRTLWVFRYYDLDDRKFAIYGEALLRLIRFIRALATPAGGTPPRVNILAHSMGGLIVREAIQRAFVQEGLDPAEHINKVVTLGTPHQGISFQILQRWLLLDASEELEHFNPERQQAADNPVGFGKLREHFPLERILTVVGTNYRSYALNAAVVANRLFPIEGEFGFNYNRSDGLVKQAFAQIPGAPRTFVHKCHGGSDSLVTSREAFEIASRFFHGNLRARLRLVAAKVKRGQDFFGRSEFFFGVSIKPRRLDFELFHQSAEAENCYGPFHRDDLADAEPAFDWAGPQRLIWEGLLNTLSGAGDRIRALPDLVLRLDIYVGERDLYGIGFSDNVIFRKQVYLRTLFEPLALYVHTHERFACPGFVPDESERAQRADGGWQFDVEGSGFEGTLQFELDAVPEEGDPAPLVP